MTGKDKLIAMLKELSDKLGRELSTDGTAAELQARIDQAQVELSMLNDDDDSDNDDDLPSTDDQDDELADNVRIPTRRNIKLRKTLDIWHYKKGADKRKPKEVKRVREIVASGKIICVDTDEGALQIAMENADAV